MTYNKRKMLKSYKTYWKSLMSKKLKFMWGNRSLQKST